MAAPIDKRRSPSPGKRHSVLRDRQNTLVARLDHNLKYLTQLKTIYPWCLVRRALDKRLLFHWIISPNLEKTPNVSQQSAWGLQGAFRLPTMSLNT